MNMIKIIKNLFLINKHYHFLIVMFIISIISNLLGISMYKGNIEIFSSFSDPSLALWNQSGMYFSLLFFPIALSIVISISIFNSKKNKGFYIERLTPISYIKIVFSRVLYFVILTALTMICFLLSFYFFIYIGKIKILSFWLYLYWGVMGIIGLIPLIVLQILFSLLFNNKSVPILLSIIGSLGNFIIMRTSLCWLDPYSLMSIGMRTQQLTLLSINETLIFISINFIYGFIFAKITSDILATKI